MEPSLLRNTNMHSEHVGRPTGGGDLQSVTGTQRQSLWERNRDRHQQPGRHQLRFDVQRKLCARDRRYVESIRRIWLDFHWLERRLLRDDYLRRNDEWRPVRYRDFHRPGLFSR